MYHQAGSCPEIINLKHQIILRNRKFKLPINFLEMCCLSDDIHDYYFVSQGKTTIPNVDDGEELSLTDVRTDAYSTRRNFCLF